jgi:Xaa-Pro aminopeptidase
VLEGIDAQAAPATVVGWLRDQEARRVGLNTDASSALGRGLKAKLPELDVTSVAQHLLAQRFVKSDEEVTIMRRSAAIADAVIAGLDHYVRRGRTGREMIGDINQCAVAHGADNGLDVYPGSLNVIFGLNPSSNGFAEDDRAWQQGDTFTLELSPRVHGYFSQLTVPVCFGEPRAEVRAMYDTLLRASAAGLSEVRPGSNSARSARAMLDVIEADGFTAANLDIGHLLGLNITEPRIGLNPAFEFRTGMTLVFHPIMQSSTISMFMRGDTYLITANGVERLNHSSLEFLTL